MKCVLTDIVRITLKMVRLALQCPTLSIIPVKMNLNKFSNTQFEFSLKSSTYSVLKTNEMHNSCNQFLFHSFLSALHVSNKSSRSSSAARHNILYYTVQLVQSVQSCGRV